MFSIQAVMSRNFVESPEKKLVQQKQSIASWQLGIRELFFQQTIHSSQRLSKRREKQYY